MLSKWRTARERLLDTLLPDANDYVQLQQGTLLLSSTPDDGDDDAGRRSSVSFEIDLEQPPPPPLVTRKLRAHHARVERLKVEQGALPLDSGALSRSYWMAWLAALGVIAVALVLTLSAWLLVHKR